MASDLAGRVALVTGASRGIGESVARRLASRGARVVVNGRDREATARVCAAIEAAGGEARPAEADVARRDQVRAMVDGVLRAWSRVDILVNNAGITHRAPLATVTDDEWHRVMSTNVMGVLYCGQAVIPAMIAQGGGRIINAASYAAWQAKVGMGAYAASKASVVAMTRMWAAELAPHGITVNAYAPGEVETEMSSRLKQEDKEVLIGRIALRRFATVEDVAGAVAFLASDDARYLTGVVLEISGGKFTVQNPAEAWVQAGRP